MKIVRLSRKSFLTSIVAFAIFILVACSSDEALVTQVELNSAQTEINKEIEELKSRVAELTSAAGALNTGIDRIGDDIGQFDSDIEELISDSDTLSTSVAERKSVVEQLGFKVADLTSSTEASVARIDSDVEELISNDEVLSASVDRLGAAVGQLNSNVEEINVRKNFLGKAFELLPELSRNVATITLINRQSEKSDSWDVVQGFIDIPIMGSGFMWDERRLVTVGHVARIMSQIIEAPPPPIKDFPKFSAIAHFPLLQEENSSSSVIIILGKPRISEDGLVAVYCIDSQNGPIYNRLSPTLTFFTPATKEEIEVGEILFRISLNPEKASLGGAFEVNRIEAVSAEGSYVEKLAIDMPDYVKESLAKYMVVSGGKPGDSGGPLLIANENYDGFLLAGITEGGSIAVRADVISDFLETVNCAE